MSKPTNHARCISGTAQFENAHMQGRTDAWRDGYLAAFYGHGDELTADKPTAYVRDFNEGFCHMAEVLDMNRRANLARYNKS